MALISFWFPLHGSLSQQAFLNYELQFACSVQWLNRCREPASGSPTASLVRSMEFHQGRAWPLESHALDGALTACNIGPPYLETHRPPGSGSHGALVLPSQAGTSKQAIEQPFSTKFVAFNPPN